MEIFERIKDLRKSILKLNQEDFAKSVGLSRSNVANIEVGRINLTDRTISDICREFNINENWLRYGSGEIFVETDDTVIDQFVSEYNLTDLEKKMLEVYVKKLTPNQREAITSYLKSLALELIKSDETAATNELSYVAESTTQYHAQGDKLSESQEAYINSELELYRLELEAQAKAQKLKVSERISTENMA